jgi:hypothetical protein
MDASRLRTGELVAAVSGVALLIIMFLPWFGFSVGGAEAVEDITGVSVNVPEVSADFNAWESFDFIDLVLFVTAVVAIALGVATAMSQTVNLPVATSALTAGLGILATVLVVYRVLDTPGDSDRKYGLFLGLIAAIGIAAGGWMSMQEEGTSFGAQADRLGDSAGGDEPPAPPPPPPPPSSGAPPSAP